MDWRNPFEDFRDKYLSPKNVKGYQLLALRLGYIPFSQDKVREYREKVEKFWAGQLPPLEIDFFVVGYRDMGVKKIIGVQPWITKYFNARLSIVFNVCIWKKWLVLPFFGISIRLTDNKYIQIGLGFGAEGTLKDCVYERASMSGKFRIGNVRNEYFKGGNYDIIGLYEGII